MAEDQIRFLGDLQRLEVRPGDVFVLKSRQPLSSEQLKRIHEMWEQNGPGGKLFIQGDGFELGVVSREKLP
jgi:hypothetical protein